LQVFISYRRSDAPSASRQLAEELKLRFGVDKVFLDTRDVAAGAEWRSDALQRVQASDVVLAVIGPHWAAAAHDRARGSVLNSAAEDVVRSEIETAFIHGAMVIPVLVDDAEMPARETLPRPFRPLADVQAQVLRDASWERDLQALVETLTHLAARPRPCQRASEPPLPWPGPAGCTDAGRIARYMAEGAVVTVLGPGANAVDRDGPWQRDAGSLPDTAELARHLADWFRIGPETGNLAEVSQRVSLAEGRVDLCRTLRELLIKPDGEPTSLHRFVARLPGRLRDLGRECYQLVVTTNYDTALERALDAVHEPYDLVVFMATGPYRGRFVHVPWWDPGGNGSRPITVPNEYVDLPIDEDGALERTVIVKLHGGGVDPRSDAPHLRDNFVITEDDYIGYLTQSPVESLIPLQILNKIRESHFLFLGYRMRDWTPRVFLQRVWGHEQLEARSWAVAAGLDVVERELWEHLGVNVVDHALTEFLTELEGELGHNAEAHERA
jgi:hypothetical protein